MTKFGKLCFVITCLSASLLLALDQRASSQSQPIAIRAARLIDGRNESSVTDAVIIIEGEKITAVGSRVTIPPGAKVLDLGDVTL
jgi:imidazolonepropionase-like amidohydrolase